MYPLHRLAEPALIAVPFSDVDVHIVFGVQQRCLSSRHLYK